MTKNNLVNVITENVVKIKEKTSQMVKEKSGRNEGVVKIRLSNNMESLREQHYRLNKTNELLMKNSQELKEELVKDKEMLDASIDPIEQLRIAYMEAKERYEEALDEQNQLKYRMEEKENKIEENANAYKENEHKKIAIIEKKEELEKDIHFRMKAAILTNPDQVTKALRKEVLDLMFEKDATKYFEELEEGILRFEIADESGTNFYIDVKSDEEGMVIHSRKGDKGRMRLITHTEKKERGHVLVDPKTKERKKEIDELAKNIMYTIVETKLAAGIGYNPHPSADIFEKKQEEFVPAVKEAEKKEEQEI